MSADKPVRVIVGVTHRQPDAVVLEAAVFASRFQAELVCATVEATRYMVVEHADGSMSSLPFDPDTPELTEERFDPRLAAHLAEILEGAGVVWSTRALAGDPARALGHLAQTLGAAMIVVGTRESNVRSTLAKFISGSVAVRLAHRQHRPVVVIPLAPVPFEEPLPWEGG
ncbi:universal stress protein [Cryobacterium sp. TMT1-21]|uniref:Universal stress protein n=1 Tax=Cryobacterium shii TaxID=1259235 RepID=A0AAQ2C8Z9_9MICO|nr:MULTISPECIES: universal stress protein [Cryobacterium]TFC52902.1 universal stress protein [Cryobacterium shii]TFC81082.1 universal stress protein [Cryobacterium sp. TmT2-59]TFD09049.1 universal stress protein [Cryobacterium sp. TMT1-21]TFD18850.1 universal stress protein [Cryobacterium sp. TMT4-10]TFD21945.1 universal stress protein [Cryobacterium sp. TMT2-23]